MMLAERIFYLDVAFKKNPDAVELQKEMLAKITEKLEKNPNSINRNDVVALLINSFSKLYVPTAETSQAAIQLIFSKTLSTPEQLKALSLQATMDLSIFLSQSR